MAARAANRVRQPWLRLTPVPAICFLLAGLGLALLGGLAGGLVSKKVSLKIGVACLREQTSGRSSLYRGTRGSGNAPRQAILFEAGEALETRSRLLLPLGGAGL